MKARGLGATAIPKALGIGLASVYRVLEPQGYRDLHLPATFQTLQCVKFAAFLASNTPRRSGTPAPSGFPTARKKEENAMNSLRLSGIIVLVLACGIGTGAAQQPQTSGAAHIQLDATQRAAIVTAVRDVRIAPPGHSFNISVGAQVPPSIELNYLPIAALSQAPEARALKYTMVQNQVVLVDPTNMRIVDVIRLGQ